MTSVHRALVVLAVLAAFSGAASAAPLLGHLRVELRRPPDKQRAFDALRAAQDTPGSPEFHHWLTPREIGARFGASDADIAGVVHWLRAQGITIRKIANAKTAIEIAATADVAKRAFGVLPPNIARVVRTVRGLAPHEQVPQHVWITNTSGAHSVGAGDFAAIYDANTALTGSGQVIGIIGKARVWPADLVSYGAMMGIAMPAATVVIPPLGTDPGSACGDPSCGSGPNAPLQQEATLDAERAGSIAPGAKLELIISASAGGDDGVLVALDYAIDDYGAGADANIINLSFGSCELFYTAEEIESLDAELQQAAMQGQSVFVASGDAGANDCQPSGEAGDPSEGTTPSINWLCASSAVTCVGGTKFADAETQAIYWNGSGSAAGYIPEGAWNEATLYADEYLQLAGGGGESGVIAKPAFQSGVGGSASGRLAPDLAFDAADVEGYVVCIAATGDACDPAAGGYYTVYGGTSATAPDMAAVAALLGQATGGTLGNLDPILYLLGSASGVFHDVTVASSGVAACDVAIPSLCNNSDPGETTLTGGTIGYAVGPGFDEATGWGSLDIAALVAHWPGDATPSLAIVPGALTIARGGSASAALIPSGFASPPTFTCTGLPSGTTCSFAGTTLTISATADASAGVTWLEPLETALLVGVLLLVALSRIRTPRLRLAAAFALAASCGSGHDAALDAGTDGSNVIDAPHSVTAPVTITARAEADVASTTLALTLR